MRWEAHTAVMLLLSLLLLLLHGCATHRFELEPLKLKLAVFDMSMDEANFKDEKTIKGWWFGARDVYHNPNVGELLSDVLARELSQRVPGLDVYSRLDFKYYMAAKKERLKRHYPRLTDEQLESLFSQVSPLEFARDLMVDKIITGHINDAYLAHNRSIHIWWSTIDVNLQIIDVESGQIEWQANVHQTKWFGSQLSAIEKASKKIARQLKKRY